MNNVDLNWQEVLKQTKDKDVTELHTSIKKLMMEDDGEFSLTVQNSGDRLTIYRTVGDYYRIGTIEHYVVCYLEHEVDETEAGRENLFHVATSQYFPIARVDEAIACFITRLKSDSPYRMSSKQVSEDRTKTEGYTLEEIKPFTTKELFFDNHYTYLELMVEPLGELLFGDKGQWVFNDGMIGAHGDKGYGYRDIWKDAGINHNRGTLLYLLTYTNLLDCDKSKSGEWVVSNYERFLPQIQQLEEKIIQEQFS